MGERFRLRRFFCIALVSLGGTFLAVDAFAQATFSVDPAAEVVLKPGIGDVDLAQDGRPYHVLVLDNDVSSAHNNKTYIFFSPDNKTVFFEGGEFGIHTPSVSTSQGADYTVRSIRLIIDKKLKQSFVVVADRDFGQSYVDSGPVTIALYKFSADVDHDLGQPPAEFSPFESFTTKKCYPDADFALKAELGLSPPQGKNGNAADLSQTCSVKD